MYRIKKKKNNIIFFQIDKKREKQERKILDSQVLYSLERANMGRGRVQNSHEGIFSKGLAPITHPQKSIFVSK